MDESFLSVERDIERPSPHPSPQGGEGGAAFSIRPFDPADADSCIRIFDRAWHAAHPYAPRTIDRAVFERETQEETILVAETPGHGVIAFGAVHLPGKFIHHLYVEPSAHGRGIGKTLLARLVETAGGEATLKCQTKNPAALAFYARLGWTPGEAGASSFGPWVRMHSPA